MWKIILLLLLNLLEQKTRLLTDFLVGFGPVRPAFSPRPLSLFNKSSALLWDALRNHAVALRWVPRRGKRDDFFTGSIMLRLLYYFTFDL